MKTRKRNSWHCSKEVKVPSTGFDEYIKSSLQIPLENFKAADVEFQARFRHENIAELYGALLFDQNVHLFMEAGEGGSVLEKLESCGPMREFEIIWVTKQVLRGLEYLHSHNVIHHDVKRKCFKSRAKLMDLLKCTKLLQMGQ